MSIHMRRTIGIALAVCAAVAATLLSGSYVVGCVVLGTAVEVGVIWAAFREPVAEPARRDDDDDEGGGGWRMPDHPPDPWPPMSPAARDASHGDRVLTPA